MQCILSKEVVQDAINQLVSAGVNPTIDRIRAITGGSNRLILKFRSECQLPVGVTVAKREHQQVLRVVGSEVITNNSSIQAANTIPVGSNDLNSRLFAIEQRLAKLELVSFSDSNMGVNSNTDGNIINCDDGIDDDTYDGSDIDIMNLFSVDSAVSHSVDVEVSQLRECLSQRDKELTTLRQQMASWQDSLCKLDDDFDSQLRDKDVEISRLNAKICFLDGVISRFSSKLFDVSISKDLLIAANRDLLVKIDDLSVQLDAKTIECVDLIVCLESFKPVSAVEYDNDSYDSDDYEAFSPESFPKSAIDDYVQKLKVFCDECITVYIKELHSKRVSAEKICELLKQQNKRTSNNKYYPLSYVKRVCNRIDGRSNSHVAQNYTTTDYVPILATSASKLHKSSVQQRVLELHKLGNSSKVIVTMLESEGYRNSKGNPYIRRDVDRFIIKSQQV